MILQRKRRVALLHDMFGIPECENALCGNLWMSFHYSKPGTLLFSFFSFIIVSFADVDTWPAQVIICVYLSPALPITTPLPHPTPNLWINCLLISHSRFSIVRKCNQCEGSPRNGLTRYAFFCFVFFPPLQTNKRPVRKFEKWHSNNECWELFAVLRIEAEVCAVHSFYQIKYLLLFVTTGVRLFEFWSWILLYFGFKWKLMMFNDKLPYNK